MTTTIAKASPSAARRANLSHPVVDGDAHVLEGEFVLCDFVKQVGGADALARFENSRKARKSVV